MTSVKIAKLRALVSTLTPEGKHMQVEAIRLIADILADRDEMTFAIPEHRESIEVEVRGHGGGGGGGSAKAKGTRRG